ncbi:hypothetical protein ACFT4A_37020 [Streptomyces sp. NPDC057099]|uniref:hypothetical protein n=1 Tax=Streptomyces sp. NPDC057099 TaxID=3346019 RepID=UPI00363EB938
MRSARILLATATATAALAIAAPTAGAEAMGDRDHDNTSYSKEHHKEDKHHEPRGGVHTGGGALAAVNADDDWDNPKHDPDTYKDGERGEDPWGDKHDDPYGDKRDKDWDKHDEHGKDWDKHEKDWGDKHDENGRHDEHDKPRGGVHTGGGALAAPGVTAGGLAVLAVAGSGLYALRRQRASRGTA